MLFLTILSDMQLFPFLNRQSESMSISFTYTKSFQHTIHRTFQTSKCFQQVIQNPVYNNMLIIGLKI